MNFENVNVIYHMTKNKARVSRKMDYFPFGIEVRNPTKDKKTEIIRT